MSPIGSERSSRFGATLRKLRERDALTQEQLADRASLAVRTIRALETGQVALPRSTTVVQLADALSLSGPRRERFVAEARLGGDPSDADQARDSAQLPPRQVPTDPIHFTGRDRDLAATASSLRRGPTRPTSPCSTSSGPDSAIACW